MHQLNFSALPLKKKTGFLSWVSVTNFTVMITLHRFYITIGLWGMHPFTTMDPSLLERADSSADSLWDGEGVTANTVTVLRRTLRVTA